MKATSYVLWKRRPINGFNGNGNDRKLPETINSLVKVFDVILVNFGVNETEVHTKQHILEVLFVDKNSMFVSEPILVNHNLVNWIMIKTNDNYIVWSYHRLKYVF